MPLMDTVFHLTQSSIQGWEQQVQQCHRQRVVSHVVHPLISLLLIIISSS